MVTIYYESKTYQRKTTTRMLDLLADCLLLEDPSAYLLPYPIQNDNIYSKE